MCQPEIIMSLDQDLNYIDNVQDFAFSDEYDSLMPEDSSAANASLDLLEQHQAKEQARLLHKFKELRQWQQQQQQQLMQQQHQQLKAWQDEQSKVSLLIANQQGVSWNKGLKPGPRGQQSAILTPPSKPHTLAGMNTQKDSDYVHQSLGAGISLDSGLATSMQDTLKSQSSLPKPVMYIDPSESLNPNDDDKYTNSELFSNPGSHDDQFDILKGDDAHPAPDWMSDNSDNFIPSKLPPPRPIRGGRNGGINDQMAGLEQLLTTAPAGLLQQVLNMFPVKGRMNTQLNYSDEIELSASPTLLIPGQLPRARKLQFQEPPSATTVQTLVSTTASLSQEQQLQHQLNQLRQQQQRQQNQNNAIKNVISGPQKFNLGLVLTESGEDEQCIPRGLALSDDRNLPVERDEAGSDEWEDQDEDDDEEGDNSQNITAKEVQSFSQEDRPIIGLAGKKSFEQLLEEQLRAEDKKLDSQNVTNKPNRKPFLRKGEGISRFNSAPRKQPKHVSRKPDRKSTVVHTNGLSRSTAKGNRDSEVNQPFDVVDGNKRPPVGCGLKDMKKPAIVAKPMEKKAKITSKNIPSSMDVTADKSGTKHVPIQNGLHKKMEELKFQQQESSSYKADREAINLIKNGILNEIDRSPIPDSKSNKSDDKDSCELDSLAEFEFLEDAMDNISFRSNSSLVQKLLVNDRQGQKEIMDRLKIINEAKKANNIIPASFSVCPSWTSTEKDSNGFMNDAVTGVGRDLVLNGNNSNNNSNVETAAAGSELSDGTLTDSSDEDNTCGREGQIRNGKTSPQVDAGTTNVPTSNSGPLQSPSKVMPRKVAPLASKFSAANDTLSMLKALSLQAGFLTASNVPVSVRANMNVTSKHGHVSAAVSSPTSDLQGSLTSDNSRNHQLIRSSTNYSLAPSNFSESNNSPNDVKFIPAPVLYGDVSQASAAFGPKNRPESKQLLSSVSSLQVTGENKFQFNSQSGNIDADYLHKKSYDSHQYEVSSDSDESNDISDESNDDFGQVDNMKLTLVDEDTNLGFSSVSQAQSGNRVVTKNCEPHIAVAPPPTCFDDEMSWVDEEEENNDNVCLKTSGSSASMTATHASSPPTSKLMSRLFPKLKPKQNIETEKASQALHQVSSQPVNVTNGLQSHILREKLMELDREIERFRSENSNLEMLRREREEGLSKLKQEIDNFQREKEVELRRLEEFKTEELKKLKRERKLFDSYQKKVRSMPDKRDREEIDVLKTQLQEIQDELRRKESRWNASTARLKNRQAELELENGELKEEIRILEKKRLEWMTSQSSVRTSVQSNGKIGPGDSGVGKYGGARRQASATHVRSSTPTKEIDRVKVSSSTGLRDSSAGASSGILRTAVATVTSANSGSNKGGKAGTGSNVIHSSPPTIYNGVGAPASKGAAQKPQTPAPAPTNLAGDGLQNNPVPMMMENTLPAAAQVSAMPGSLASSMSSSIKSAAHAAMERAVIDKGDVPTFVEVKHQDGKVEKTYKTGAKEIYFPNGTVKEVSPDGQTIICRLANGDIRQIFPDHRVVYIFAEAQIMQTTFPDGLETFQFKNGQIERRYPDGTVEITFPSKDVKYLFPDGGQEVILTDGTVMQYNTKGERVVEYPSGDREVHTAEYQRREFPDGIVKTVYSDGRHETRFPNGRIRLRDKAGNVIMDQIVYR